MGAIRADSRSTTADNETAHARRYTTGGVSTVQLGRSPGAKPALGVLRSHDTARRDVSGRHQIPPHLDEPHTAGWLNGAVFNPKRRPFSCLCRSCWTTRVGLEPSAIPRT
jgi:hypothetical protein